MGKKKTIRKKPHAVRKSTVPARKGTRQSSLESLREWYDLVRPQYERLTEAAVLTLKGILDSAGISYLSTYGRTKSRQSFLEKTTRKPYSDPKVETTDFSGVRIIVYKESDIALVNKLIEDSFHVDKGKSGDKSVALGVDRVGYRSVHFVCSFGEKREKLPEFRRFSKMVFEIQVRTVLEHAWAEIEHANYKLGNKLPINLQRRLRLAAGLLESADRELDILAREIEAYGDTVARNIQAGNLDVELDIVTLSNYVTSSFPELPPPSAGVDVAGLYANIIDELRGFGVGDLRNLAELLDEDALAATQEIRRTSNVFGFLRSVMMYRDMDKYLSRSWKHHWAVMRTSLFELLCSRYGKDRVEAALHQYDIEVDLDE